MALLSNITSLRFLGVSKKFSLMVVFLSIFNFSIFFFTVKYPCGKVFVTRKKRSVLLPADYSNGMSDQEGLPTNETSTEENFVITTESPTPQPDNRTSSRNPNVHTRIVGGDECLPGQCPWQVNGGGFALHVGRACLWGKGSSGSFQLVAHVTCQWQRDIAELCDPGQLDVLFCKLQPHGVKTKGFMPF